MDKYEIVFESENIIYVKLSKELINDYLTMINDPNIQKFISPNQHVYSYEDELNWVISNLEKETIRFSMIEKRTGEYIGNIGITEVGNNIGELGITITANKQNKHYGYESIKAMIEYGYNVLNLSGIELNVNEKNSRAIHCYEKVGFIKTGIGKTQEDIHMKISR